MGSALAAVVSFIIIAAAATLVFAQDPYNALSGVVCHTKVGEERSSMVDVYQVAVPSNATICVNDSFKSFGVASFSSDYGPINGSSFSACGASNGTKFFACPGLSVTVSPPTAIHVPGQTITIAYKVSASYGLNNGTYWLFIDSCSPIVLVVGPTPPFLPSWATGADLLCTSSMSGPATSQVAGVTNVNVVAVSIK